MDAFEIISILVAGVAAGTINTVVGSGTLITFPVLLAFGFPPVVATMTNAVGLVPGSVSGTWGYRRELKGQWPRLRWQVPGSLIGSIIGAFLLLHLPEQSFKKIVPVLLVLALSLVILQPRIQVWARRRAARGGRDHARLTPGQLTALVIGTFLTGIYGGYFAAAQGIVLVGIMGALLTESMQRLNAAKNLLSLIVNCVAALTYTLVAFHRIDWAAAGLLATGTLIGGFCGAHVGRKLSPLALRVLIVTLGVVAIIRLLL